MLRTANRMLLLIAATASLVTGSCASNDGGRRIEAFYPKSYESVTELAEDAKVIVAFVPSGDTATEVISGLYFTTTTVRVVKELKGDVGDTIRVRQAGSRSPQLTVGNLPLVEEGKTYLAFLGDAPPTAEGERYLVVGGTGLFEVKGDRVLHLDERGFLERSRPLTDVESEVRHVVEAVAPESGATSTSL